ncbi:MAG: NAD(P)-dependent oxidoreductase [Caldilineaceae bacterium]
MELCSLEDVFRRADVVSLHAPWLDETVGLLHGHHFAAMKQDATFINTACGAIVREDEMIAVLQDRPDLWAILDVTYPEPPVPGSPLYTLPNVVLTPHIAGSLNNECRRMGRLTVEELRKFVNEALTWKIGRASGDYGMRGIFDLRLTIYDCLVEDLNGWLEYRFCLHRISLQRRHRLNTTIVNRQSKIENRRIPCSHPVSFPSPSARFRPRKLWISSCAPD